MLDGTTEEAAVDVPRRRRARDALTAFGAFALYLTGSVLIFGGTTALRLGTYYIPRQNSSDSYFFRWALTWVPWAIERGHDPLATDAVFAPYHVTLTWVTIVPGPALVMWPVTRMFGSLVSYNVLVLLAPALDGWAAFLLCRRLTRSFWASLAGGFFFGFSALFVQHINHPNLTLAFPIPLLVYLVVRRMEGSLRRWTFVALLSLTLVALWFISIELFATATMFAGIAMGIAFVVGRDERTRLWSTTLQVGVAYAIVAAVVFLPYLWPALRTAPHTVMRDVDRSTDLVRLVLPNSYDPVVVGGAWLQALGTRYTGLAYIGAGIVALLIGFAITEWRRRSARGLLAFAGVGVLLALGPTLVIARHRTIPLPSAILGRLPLLQQAVPSRFLLYVHLAVAVIVAMWLVAARGRGIWVRWIIVICAAALAIPAIASPPWHVPDTTPAFFTDGTYRSVISPGETVLVIPEKGSEQMSWQATADFWFRMPNGYVGITPQGVPQDPLRTQLHASGHGITPEELRAWLDQHGVTAIIVDDEVFADFEQVLRATGFQPVDHSGGVSVWRQA